MLKEKFILLVMAIVLSLTIVGCDFVANGVTGHVTLSNTEVDWKEEFHYPATTQETDISQKTNQVESKEDYIEGRILVRFESDEQKEAISNDYQELSKIRRLEQLPLYLFETEEDIDDLITELEAEAGVKYAERNYIYHKLGDSTNAEHYEKQWHYSAISLLETWELAESDDTARVAVLDTGIDSEHPEFKKYNDESIVYKGKNFAGKNEDEKDYDKGDYMDRDGHGTHVAGTIAALDNQEKVVGVAYDNLELLAGKVLGDDGTGGNYGIAAGIRWAIDEGVDVINMSLGGSLPSQAMIEALDYADQNNVTVIAASGNHGGASMDFPAEYDDVISVGATDYNNQVTNFSNRGVKLDVVAPGADIYSIISKEYVYYDDNNLKIGERDYEDAYSFMGGTSMAAPHVSGVAALLIVEGVAETPDEIREQLRLTAHDLGAENEGNKGWDSSYGYGMINAHAAIVDARITEAKVFAGEKEGNTIETKNEQESVNDDGFYELDLVDDNYYIYSWIDVTGSGTIEQGDYFAKSSNPVDSGVDVDLSLELITDDDFEKIELN